MNTDQNGERVCKNIHKITSSEHVGGRVLHGEHVGAWTRRVWAGTGSGVFNARMYVYSTRAAARAGGISDEIGRYGRVA